MGGVRTRVRGKYSSFVVDTDSHANQVNSTNTQATQIADLCNSVNNSVVDTEDLSHSVQVSPINQLFSSNANAINCHAVKKVRGLSGFLGKAGTIGIGKAIDFFDRLGSSVADLNLSSDFNSGAAMRGDKISILAFEVAKTILKGHKLMQSLSDDNIQCLKMTVVSSKGVRELISEDTEEILRIAAADKREELESFVREVARFGNRCRDSQWRDLDRYFDRLAWDRTPRKRFNVDSAMVELMNLVHHTAELLSEMYKLDKVEREHSTSLEDESIFTTVQKGDFAILTDDMKSQKKLVKSLQKKSLWSKSFEEVVKKLVHVVHVLVFKMNEAFGSADLYKPVNDYESKKRLGPSGTALHYATIITQIDTLGSLLNSAPPSMRDDLYQRLPHGIKSALLKKLQSFPADLECIHIKAEMEKTMQWLGPIARNTTKALQGLGWTGGWANFMSEVNQEAPGHAEVLRIETLYHADIERTEACILELVVWLHHLIVRSRNSTPSSRRSNHRPSLLSFKDQEILDNAGENISKYGVSRSQNFAASKTGMIKIHRFAKSGRESQPSRKAKKDPLRGWPSIEPVIDFDINRIKVLDIIDGLERT